MYLKYRKDDHFSVLRGIDGNTVLLADPSLGHVSMSRVQFLDAWKTREGNLAGKILAVVPKGADTGGDKAFSHAETFAKFLFLQQPKPKNRFSAVFSPQSLLILPKYPLNPPRIPDNQASGPPFRRQQAHLAC